MTTTRYVVSQKNNRVPLNVFVVQKDDKLHNGDRNQASFTDLNYILK